MDPINYNVQIADPFKAYTEGLKFNTVNSQLQLANDQAKQEQAVLAEQPALREKLKSTLANPNATAADYAPFMALMPKEHTQQIASAFGMMESSKQDAKVQDVMNILGPVNAGRYDLAIDALEKKAGILEEQGNKAEAEASRVMAKIIKDHPEQAKEYMITTLLATGEKGSKGVNALASFMNAETNKAEEPLNTRIKTAEADKAELELKNLPEKQKLDNAILKERVNEIEANAELRRAKALAADVAKLGGTKDYVSQLGIDGKLDITKLRKPQIEAINRAAALADAQGKLNEFNPAKFVIDQKVKTANEINLAKGKMGDNVTSLNTAIEHLDTFRKISGELNNDKPRFSNYVKNAIKDQFGDKNLASFEAVKTFVADEIIKTVVPGSGSAAERIAMGEKIRASSSPEQFKGLIKAYNELLTGRMKSIKLQYESSGGEKDMYNEKLSPKARAIVMENEDNGQSTDDVSNRANKWINYGK